MLRYYSIEKAGRRDKIEILFYLCCVETTMRKHIYPYKFMNRRTVLTMVLVGLLGFAQAQNNSNDTRKAPQAANPTEQRGPGGPGGRQAPKTALESDCYSDAEKQLIREVAEKFEQRTYTGSNVVDRHDAEGTGSVRGRFVGGRQMEPGVDGTAR